VQAQGEADLLVDPHLSSQTRFSPVQDPPEEGARKDRRRMRGQGVLLQGERAGGRIPRRKTLPHAEGERVEQGERLSAVEGYDGLQAEASKEVQEQIPQEEQRGIEERLTQGGVRRVPLQQGVAHAEEGGRPEGRKLQHQAAHKIQDKTGGRDMGQPDFVTVTGSFCCSPTGVTFRDVPSRAFVRLGEDSQSSEPLPRWDSRRLPWRPAERLVGLDEVVMGLEPLN
jgi:hypothetical protein